MSVLILYASTSGNVELVVDRVAQVWREAGKAVELARAEQFKPERFQDYQNFVLATSTWEHGELNPFFVPLYEAMATLDFHGKKAAMLGLGDIRYEVILFCRGMDMVTKRWTDRGGVQVGKTLKLNGEPYHQLEDRVVPWAQETGPLLYES